MAQKYLENIQFLIVDDNLFFRTTCRLVLHAMGSRGIREASNGAEALKTLDGFYPDILIVDWEMSPINGIELIQHIRGDTSRPLAFAPIIMLSGHTEEARITVARDVGINEFVIKPFSAKSLFSRIQAVIERPRPFVRIEGYFGPDRRRKSQPIDGEDRRNADTDTDEDEA